MPRQEHVALETKSIPMAILVSALWGGFVGLVLFGVIFSSGGLDGESPIEALAIISGMFAFWGIVGAIGMKTAAFHMLSWFADRIPGGVILLAPVHIGFLLAWPGLWVAAKAGLIAFEDHSEDNS